MMKYNIMGKGFIFLLLALPYQGFTQQQDCRLDLKAILPVVDTLSARVMDYEWDPGQRMEIMLIDSIRMAIITQDGCMRHYTRFQLELFRPLSQPSTEDWMKVINSFIFPLFKQSPSYRELWNPFLEAFEQNLYVHGTNQQFDISLGSQDFLCFVQELPNQNPAIYIEQIGFLFKEKVKKSN